MCILSLFFVVICWYSALVFCSWNIWHFYSHHCCCFLKNCSCFISLFLSSFYRSNAITSCPGSDILTVFFYPASGWGASCRRHLRFLGIFHVPCRIHFEGRWLTFLIGYYLHLVGNRWKDTFISPLLPSFKWPDFKRSISSPKSPNSTFKSLDTTLLVHHNFQLSGHYCWNSTSTRPQIQTWPDNSNENFSFLQKGNGTCALYFEAIYHTIYNLCQFNIIVVLRQLMPISMRSQIFF